MAFVHFSWRERNPTKRNKTRAVLLHRPLATNENWGFEADLIAGAVRLIRTKILKACSDKLLILLVFENSGYQSHGQEP